MLKLKSKPYLAIDSMNHEISVKKTYSKPQLTTFGAAKELTQGSNTLGGGDAIFNILLPSR
jgi:hypothetical protein